MKSFLLKVLLLLLCNSVMQTALGAEVHGDEQALLAARKKLKHHHGGDPVLFAMADRLEYQSNDGESLSVWEGQGWYGGDINKLWLKTEGEYAYTDNQFEDAEVQLLYSRAISPYWDIQAGLRYDIYPDPSRHFAVVGVQGIAPYWFEIDAAGFVSDKGKLSFRLEVEYELLLSQRLILQPRVEFNIALQDDAEIKSGSGLNTIDTGFRIRYEFTREFAPYIGVSWGRSFGATAEFKQVAGEQTEQLSVVAGVRVWY